MENLNFEGFDNEVIDVNIVDEVSEINSPVTIQAEPLANPTPEFDFDFSKLGIPGLISGDIGLQVSMFAVDRMKFTTSSKSRIAIVTDKVLALRTHFTEELGSFICFEGECCNLCGAPRVKYLFPIVIYDTDKNGRPVSLNVENKVLAVGKGVYEDIMTIHELNEGTGGVTSVDLLVTCRDEKYQDISIQAAGPCNWKKKPEIISQVTDFWSKNMEHLYKAVARQVTEKDFKAKMYTDEGPTDGDISYEDIFK